MNPVGYRLGVGIMLLNTNNQVLLCQRGDIAEETWQMPQGGLGLGEDPFRGALRELKEEIGTDSAALIAESASWYQYDLPAELLNKTWGGKYFGQRQKWFLLRFLGSDEDIELHTHVPEFINWRWAEPAEVLTVAVAFKRPLYRSVLLEFAEKVNLSGAAPTTMGASDVPA
jgi:putative (di)nucleoside polyphosphate hydrolase